VTDRSSDPEAVSLPADPAVADPAAAPRRRRLWPWLALLLIIAGGGWWAWDAWQRLQQAEQGRDAWQHEIETLQRSIDGLGSELSTLRERQRALDSRLTDTGSGQRVLREEVLGLGERAALLEDALARLAQTRQEGAQAMLLDEAEFLLLTGEERLHLFGDVEAAIRAFTLADAAIGGLQEPIYATLRQTLAQEVAMLRALPADPRPALRAELAALPTIAAGLPSSDERRDTKAERSRLAQLLDQVVTVRRLDSADAPLSPMARSARLSALGLQGRLALAAFEDGDTQGWAQGMRAARELAASLFDGEDARVRAFLDRLDALAEISPPSLPTLGATLRELRGLRATRRLSAQRAATPISPVGASTPTTIEATPGTKPGPADGASAIDDAAEPLDIEAIDIDQAIEVPADESAQDADRIDVE